jgi:hypothetical protein
MPWSENTRKLTLELAAKGIPEGYLPTDTRTGFPVKHDNSKESPYGFCKVKHNNSCEVHPYKGISRDPTGEVLTFATPQEMLDAGWAAD